jgi:uncharacterized protein (TIRG00374 family)
VKKNIIAIFKVLLFACVGMGIIAWFWLNLEEKDKAQFWESLNKADYFWLFISILAGALSHVSRAFRWRLIIQPFGFVPKVYNLFFAVMNMYFANMAVPRLGEITRCAILHQYEKIPFEKSFGTVVAERAVDMLVLLLIFGFAGIIFLDHFETIWNGLMALKQTKANVETIDSTNIFRDNLKYMIISLFILVFLIVFIFRKRPAFEKVFLKIQSVLRGFWEGLKSVVQIRQKVEFAFHSIFIFLMYYVMTYVCFFSLEETANVGWQGGLAVLVFGSVATILVPGGIGLFPVIVAAVLNIPLFGNIDPGIGLALGWIIWAAQTLLILILGIISFILLPVMNKTT